MTQPSDPLNFCSSNSIVPSLHQTSQIRPYATNTSCAIHFLQRTLRMSDTCIVCLGDLSNGNTDLPAPSVARAKSPRQDGHEPETTDADPAPTTTSNPNNDESLIAHLQPCGHDLHNECLTPWVERANSCPICRQSFHLVELTERVGGESALFTTLAQCVQLMFAYRSNHLLL